MTNEELNTMLYKKMFEEQEEYKGWLLSQSPEEILNHAYEYAMREDILMSLEYNDLDDAQAHALLESPAPLADVYKDWQKRDPSYMEEIWDCITQRADKLVALQDQRGPVYTHSAEYAKEHEEIDSYRASFKANVACRNSIEEAIADHYRNNQLDPAGAKDVINRFGFERTSYVLANSVQRKEWDGRISPNNKKWAKDIFVSEGGELLRDDARVRFAVNSHPGLMDLFISQVRHELLLTLPLTPDDIRQEAQRLLHSMQSQQQPNSPNGTHFMAQVSPDFMLRASSKDLDALFNLFPFKGASMTALKDREGTYIFVPKEADINRPLREPKKSVLSKLHDVQPAAAPKRTGTKSKGQEL